MPCSCMYPGCGLKPKRFHQESFHELPYRHNDQELLQQWMVVLNMDITTPVETLKKKRYRVCSRHFDKDDFIHPTTVKESKRVHRVRVQLRRNAIPRVGPPATDTVEAGDQQPAQAIIDDEFDMIQRPQSTPVKSQDTTSKSRVACLTLSLRSPESSDVRPRTRRSLSGMYMARTPTWKLSEFQTADASELQTRIVKRRITGGAGMPQRRSLQPDESRGPSLVPPIPAASTSELEQTQDSKDLNVQQLFVIKEEVPWSSSVDQQDPEPVHIKKEEEEEELWSRREGEQLHGQEETDISRFSVTAVTVKSEEDEEQPQSSQLLQIKTEDSRETEPETGLNHDGGCNTARKSFSCSDCSKQFVHERSLKIHMRVHTGDPPFGCDVCGKRFSQNGLKIHMRFHTRPKPFVCDVCGKTFRRETHLESHMRFHEENHHLAVMIVKDYFAKNTDLKKHLQPQIR
ncbi:uncharacterized protein PAE49_001064 [Odontesthes bonariensis]|uniref:uncharacterized protein LOC142373599 n=1 Tax=Odontesthes bonariensis TaxID=219752 RepID=UPI003F58F0D3